MIPVPGSRRYIKLAVKVFRYDDVLTTWGWTHDVYFDTQVGVYLVANFPAEGQFFELSKAPQPGYAEMTTGGKTYRTRVYEP